MSSLPVFLQLNVPFQTHKQAQIALKALSPDPVLKADQSSVDYAISEENVLNIKINGIDDRIVRVTANNLLENLKTVIECFENFELSH